MNWHLIAPCLLRPNKIFIEVAIIEYHTFVSINCKIFYYMKVMGMSIMMVMVATMTHNDNNSNNDYNDNDKTTQNPI